MLERYSHLSPPERCLAGNGSFVVAAAPPAPRRRSRPR